MIRVCTAVVLAVCVASTGCSGYFRSIERNFTILPLQAVDEQRLKFRNHRRAEGKRPSNDNHRFVPGALCIGFFHRLSLVTRMHGLACRWRRTGAPTNEPR